MKLSRTVLAIAGIALLAGMALVANVPFLAAAVPIAADVVHYVQANAAALGLGGAFFGTTLAANKPRAFEIGEESHVPAVATDIIYEGAAVGDNGSGYGRPLVAADPFRGFAIRQCDNSAGAAGDLNIRVLRRGEIELTLSAVAITDVGAPVYASDDDAFTLTAASNSFIGRIKRYVSSTKAVVEFDATRGGLGKLWPITHNTGTTNYNDKGTALTTNLGTFAVTDPLLNTIVDRINLISQMLSK